ncbi:MAG: UDP-N-acetyl glucosamine 2-epimerase [bacterium]
MKLKVFLVAGARPNFMKIAPVFRQMQKYPEAFHPIIVHTGQHYDDNMSRVFFDDLELPRPDIYLDVGSASHATQTAEIMKRFEAQLLKHKPDVVLVVGDVNSTIACALTAVKVRIPSVNLGKLWQHYENHLQKRGSERKQASQHEWRIHSHEAPIIGHIEAGERSFDFRMPEEINRVTTDVLSDILFTTSNDGDKNLLAEGIDPRKIFCVGNIMIDSLQKCLAKAEQSKILEEMNRNHRPNHMQPIQGGQFALVTLHRPGNVDEPANLAMILSALIRISASLPIILPMHPRTRKLLSNLEKPFRKQISKSHILITAPIGYLDFLHLQTRARMVLTDSGGVQVETSYLGVPCLTLRPNTEWQITLREGTNKLVPMNEEAIVEAANTILGSKMSQPANIKYWDGGTASRIVSVFKDLFQL